MGFITVPLKYFFLSKEIEKFTLTLKLANDFGFAILLIALPLYFLADCKTELYLTLTEHFRPLRVPQMAFPGQLQIENMLVVTLSFITQLLHGELLAIPGYFFK